MTGDISALVTGLWPALIAKGVDPAGTFAARARVSYPPAGQGDGQEAVADYLNATQRWLARQDARWEPLATTIGPSRVVDEGLLVLQRVGGEIRLPVATVADAAGDRISWLRVYHSMWPLEGRHTVRPPLLPAEPNLPLPGAVGVYQDALARGDLDAILAAFGPDGCAREPSGGPYVYCGPEALRGFYSSLFGQGGGITLQHCTVTDDGVRCAIEYNAVGWGRKLLPPQAGVAVYERGPDGLLVAARIYDDVDPPTSA